MLINNCYNNNQPSFKCIKIENGGLNLIKKEGADALTKVIEAEQKCKKYKWQLNINENDYSLTSPTTKKTYKGPFTIKRHIKKKENKPDEYSVIIGMSDNSLETYTVNYDTQQDIQQIYKEVKNSKGLDKMIKLLEILERGFKLKALRKKIAALQKIAAQKNQE